jgi:hypothetical protein
MIITFTDSVGVSKEYSPIPASKNIPNWYKDLDSYTSKLKEKVPDGKGSTTGTIKRCMPVFDAIGSGYIITSYTDVFVSQKEELDENNNVVKAPWYEWPSFKALDFHPLEQAPSHPYKKDNFSYPKWINPWSIKTPPGYSVLIIQPVHRDSVFTILPGVVDTDTYSAPINFPFTFNDPNFEGLIPAGTPIAQIIPFKRDDWKMTFGNEKNLEEQKNTFKKLRNKIFDSYKTQFRQPKEYK